MLLLALVTLFKSKSQWQDKEETRQRHLRRTAKEKEMRARGQVPHCPLDDCRLCRQVDDEIQTALRLEPTLFSLSSSKMFSRNVLSF